MDSFQGSNLCRWDRSQHEDKLHDQIWFQGQLQVNYSGENPCWIHYDRSKGLFDWSVLSYKVIFSSFELKNIYNLMFIDKFCNKKQLVFSTNILSMAWFCSKEFLTLMVSNSGFLRLVFDFGFERQEIVYEKQNFLTGQFHDVKIERFDQGK